MDTLKIGVIGSGGRGRIALLAHKAENGSRIVATCDISAAQLEKDRQDYGVDIFATNDYRALLRQELDAVFVAVPDFLHEEIAVEALRACPAVYLEKPMAITTAGTDHILDVAKETGSRLYLGHNMRHMPFVLRMKQLVDEGAIGEVKAVWCRHFVGHGGDYYFKDWHAERKHTNSLLLQKGSHDIDIIHWLAGSYSTLVTAMGGLTVYDRVADRQEYPPSKPPIDFNNWPPLSQTKLSPVIDIEDINMMLMNLENGIFASYQECHYTPDYWRNYTVIGTEGRLENFGNSGENTVVKLWNRRGKGYDAGADQTFSIATQEEGHGGSDERIIGEFLRFARDGGQTTTSPLAARFSVAAGIAGAESLRQGSVPVPVPPVKPEIREYFSKQEAT